MYKTEQQRIRYLIEFTTDSDTVLELEGLDNLEMAMIEDDDFLSQDIGQFMFNPYVMNGLSHSYQLDESILILRGIRSNL